MTTISRASVLAAGAVVLALLAPTAPAGADDRASRSAPTTRLDVSDLETGAPPGVGWAERRSGRTVLHGVGDVTTPVPNNLTAFAPMGSGFVVQTGGSRPASTRWVGADGTRGRHEWRTGLGLAVSPRGNVVAFAGTSGKVRTIDHEGDRVLRLNPVPVTGRARAVTVNGESCQEGEGHPGSGCTVTINGPRRAFSTSSHGIVDRVPRLRQVTTGRLRWIGGITSLDDFGSCSAMMRRTVVRWRTCDNQLADLSPDNQHVIGTPAYADGFGPQTLDLLSTADGSVARAFTAARSGRSATYFGEVWEDAEHVLVVTYQDSRWAIVRLGIDGSMEYAVAPRRGSSDVRSPFQLQTR